VFEILLGERPADGAVAQRHHLVLFTPALISDWVPMIERVRPAQLTMMVCRDRAAASAARSTSSPPGTLIEPRECFMVAYSSKRRTSSILILALRADQAGYFLRRQRGRVAARLDKFAKCLA